MFMYEYIYFSRRRDPVDEGADPDLALALALSISAAAAQQESQPLDLPSSKNPPNLPSSSINRYQKDTNQQADFVPQSCDNIQSEILKLPDQIKDNTSILPVPSSSENSQKERI